MRKRYVILYLLAGLALGWAAVQWAWGTGAHPNPQGALETDSPLLFHAKYFLAGSLCACLSHVGGVPIDVLKTRLQTDPGRYDGLWDAAWKVTRTEGAGMLLQGLGPTAAGYAVQGGLKYGLYELFKVWLAGDTAVLALPLSLLLLAAACAELIASTALCPYEAARIRLVSDPSFAVGLIQTLRRLVSEQGVYGVFGALPAMYLKMVPYTMAQLATYDGVTRALAAHMQASGAGAASSGGGGSSSSDTLVRSSPAVQHGDLATFGIALVGAATAALVASLASQPGDTLLSKLNQGRRALMPRASVAPQSLSGTPGSSIAMKSVAVRKQREGGLPAGSSSANALGAATGAGSIVTSSDDESGANGDDPLAPLAGGGADSGGAARASPSGGNGVDGAPTLGSSRPSSNFGCGPMCALAARLGPAGLMLGWQARLMHTGTIVLFQLLVYDAVKAAVGLPVSAHGAAAAERRLL